MTDPIYLQYVKNVLLTQFFIIKRVCFLYYSVFYFINFNFGG